MVKTADIPPSSDFLGACMADFSPIRPVSLREKVAEQIRTAIIEGRLKPNDHIVEANLTQQLGVSRTPVREALILLEREALIVSLPHRGSFVRAFDEDDVDAIFTMRTTLENFAGELVMERLDDSDFGEMQHLIERQRHYIDQDNFKMVRSTDMAFHAYLVNRSAHPVLYRNWQEIVAQIAAVLYVRAEAQLPEMDEYRAISDHLAIVGALRARDLERLRAENKRINQRVMDECKLAVRLLADGRPVQPI
jgi:DNA-binding GntR family transcriptional regulator